LKSPRISLPLKGASVTGCDHFFLGSKYQGARWLEIKENEPLAMPAVLSRAGAPVLLQGLHSDVEAEIDSDIKTPLELRGLWNPLVDRKTLDRLQNYESPQNPGALEANFDWQSLFLTGASF
jgi:hypothetical protein